MKFGISIFDGDRYDSKQEPSLWQVAEVANPKDAAIMGVALARAHVDEQVTVNVFLKEKGRGHDWAVHIHAPQRSNPHSSIDDIGVIDQVDALVERHRAHKGAMRRRRAFEDGYCPSIHADYDGWRAARAKMDDAKFCEAVRNEDYIAARARAVEIGLQLVSK